jgi:hypothetical protein
MRNSRLLEDIEFDMNEPSCPSAYGNFFIAEDSSTIENKLCRKAKKDKKDKNRKYTIGSRFLQVEVNDQEKILFDPLDLLSKKESLNPDIPSYTISLLSPIIPLKDLTWAIEQPETKVQESLFQVEVEKIIFEISQKTSQEEMIYYILKVLDHLLISSNFKFCDTFFEVILKRHHSFFKDLEISYNLLNITYLDRKEIPHRKLFIDSLRKEMQKSFSSEEIKDFLKPVE